jgi:hypothetical protein
LYFDIKQTDEFDITLELLKKAEVLTERHRMVRAVTFNNFACYYRKRGKLRTALSYVRKALAIESKLKDNVKAYIPSTIPFSCYIIDINEIICAAHNCIVLILILIFALYYQSYDGTSPLRHSLRVVLMM